MRESRLVHIIASSVTVVFLTGCAAPSSSPTGPSPVASSFEQTAAAITGDTAVVRPMNAPAPATSTANYEIKFMTNMIDHHQMAIEMAQLCLTRAVHSELGELCQSIISAQSAEIQQMQSWLQRWYGVTYEPSMKRGDQKMLDRLASLSGAEFEIAFMEMMIQHHQKAITEAQTCLEKASHAELVRLCRNIIRTQSAEIEQLQTWLCQWYGRCQ